MCAPLRPEPLPPAGIDANVLDAALAAAFGDALAADLVQWRDVDWPAWAREAWRRLEQAQAECSRSASAGPRSIFFESNYLTTPTRQVGAATGVSFS